MKGKLIVIDGTDGSGKATQTRTLVERLQNEGHTVHTLDFPRYYDNFFGGFIGDCLAGKHGDWAGTDPRIASVVYAADRFESKKELEAWLDAGDIVILDRYVSSNQIHQAGKIKDDAERQAFLLWLDKMEHEIFELPRPDMIVYLDVSVTTTQKLLQKKSLEHKKRYLDGQADQHENDAQHLQDAKASGLRMIEKMNQWSRIVCDVDGEMRTIEDIHEEVYTAITPILSS